MPWVLVPGSRWRSRSIQLDQVVEHQRVLGIGRGRVRSRHGLVLPRQNLPGSSGVVAAPDRGFGSLIVKGLPEESKIAIDDKANALSLPSPNRKGVTT